MRPPTHAPVEGEAVVCLAAPKVAPRSPTTKATRPPVRWSTSEICAWATRHRLPNAVVAALRSHRVTGADLFDLDLEDTADMGLVVAHGHDLLAAVAALAAQHGIL